jgi:hypothetical protein
MAAWVWVVVVLAALKCAGAFAAIIASGNITPDGYLHSTYRYGVLILAYGLSGAVLITARTRDVRAVWLGCVLLLAATPFAEAVLTCCAHSGATGIDAVTTVVIRLPIVPLLPVFLWLFVRDFPQAATGQTSRRVLGAALAIATTVATVLVLSNLSELVWPSGGAASDVRAFLAKLPRRSLYWPLVFLVSLPALVYLPWKARAAAPGDRRRLRIFVAGLLIGFVPISIDVLLDAFVPSLTAYVGHREATAWLVFASLVALPFVTSYSVLIDRVVEIRLVIRSALQYALARYTLLSLMTLPLAAASWYIYVNRGQTVLTLLSGTRPFLIGATVVGAAVLLARRQKVLTALDRRFFREQFDARRILSDLADRCRRAVTVDELVLLVSREIDRALHLDYVTVLVSTPDGTVMRSPDGRIRPLARTSGLALLAQGDAAPLVVDLESADSTLRRLPEEERHWLTDSGFGLLVPLKAGDGALIGLIGLGHKRSELPFSREDRLLLETIGVSVALTVENRRLRESASVSGQDRIVTPPRARGPDDGRPALECEDCGRVYPPETSKCDCGQELGLALVPYVLAGKFQFDRRLGRGGMGVVYRALDLDLGRQVAVKTLPHLGPEHAARLRREARAMATVHHENLAVIFAAETWLGTPVLVVELLAGGMLAVRIRKGPLPIPRVLEWGVALSRGVEHLHRNGVLHGDIKPRNIGFTRDEVPKILDFGLATILRRRLAGGTTTTRSATEDQHDGDGGSRAEAEKHGLAGTPLYMSPEALSGAAPRPAFDVWSLSVVLFEALAGRPPFRGNGFYEISAAITRGDRPPLGEVCPSASPALSVFFDRALSQRPGDRPHTAAELGSELARLRANLQVL